MDPIFDKDHIVVTSVKNYKPGDLFVIGKWNNNKINQPCIILGPATYEDYVKVHLYNSKYNPKYHTKVLAELQGRKFYFATTD